MADDVGDLAGLLTSFRKITGHGREREDDAVLNARMYEARREMSATILVDPTCWGAVVAGVADPFDTHATSALARHRAGVVDPSGEEHAADGMGVTDRSFPPTFVHGSPVLTHEALTVGLVASRSVDGSEPVAVALRRARRVEERAVKVIVEDNLGLPVSLSSLYRSSGLGTLDLVQEGSVALVNAAKRYDATRGRPFGTYAAYWVRQAMTRAVEAGTGQIRVPEDLRRLWVRCEKVRERVARTEGRRPTDDEVAGIVGASVFRVREAAAASMTGVGMDTSVGKGGTVGDTLASENASAHDLIEAVEAGRSALDALETLDPRSKWVLVHRFGIRGAPVRSLDDLAAELDLSREGVRKIEGRALHHLRATAYAGPLAGWVDEAFPD